MAQRKYCNLFQYHRQIHSSPGIPWSHSREKPDPTVESSLFLTLQIPSINKSYQYYQSISQISVELLWLLPGRLQQPSAALSSPQLIHPCVSQSRLPAAASQSFSKHFPKAAVICSLACWEGSHLQHGLVPAFSTLEGYHVVTCA